MSSAPNFDEPAEDRVDSEVSEGKRRKMGESADEPEDEKDKDLDDEVTKAELITTLQSPMCHLLHNYGTYIIY